MIPRILYLHPKTYKRLICLRKQAERDGAYRVAKRLQAVVLNSEGSTSGELAQLLAAPRSRVSEWFSTLPSFWRGRAARRTSLGPAIGADVGAAETARRHSRQRPGSLRLGYGHLDSPMIAWVIEEEFGIHYHPGHVRKLLHRAGFSVQRPRRVLARANAYQQDRWQRYTYPSLKKKRSDKTGRPAYARPVAGLRFCGNAPVHSRRHTRPELRRQPQSCRNHTRPDAQLCRHGKNSGKPALADCSRDRRAHRRSVENARTGGPAPQRNACLHRKTDSCGRRHFKMTGNVRDLRFHPPDGASIHVGSSCAGRTRCLRLRELLVGPNKSVAPKVSGCDFLGNLQRPLETGPFARGHMVNKAKGSPALAYSRPVHFRF